MVVDREVNTGIDGKAINTTERVLLTCGVILPGRSV